MNPFQIFVYLIMFSLIFNQSPEKDFKRKEFQRIAENQIEPIILVPGLGGSSLNAKLEHAHKGKWWCFKNTDWYRLWANIIDLVPHLSAECLIHNLQPIFDPITKRINNNDGVSIEPRNFGDTESIEYLNPYVKRLSQYFRPAVDYFVNRGYQRGKSIRGAPYDFRLSPQELERIGWFNQLKELIEDTFEINNQKKVHLYTHSLGGPITSLFLGKFCTQEWKDKYIASFFALAPSFDGSIHALGALKTGKYSIIPMKMTKVLKNMGGLVWMLPRRMKKNKIIVYSNLRNYTQSEMQDLLMDMGYSDTFPLYEHLSEQEYDPTKFAPGVKLHCLYGIGKKTATALYFEKPNERSRFRIVENEEGDSTVSKFSSSFCEKFQQKEEIFVHSFKGKENNNFDFHRFLVGDKEVLDSIFQIIYGAL